MNRRRFTVTVLAVALVCGSALAAALTVSSANFTSYRTCVISGYPSTTTTVIDSYTDQLNANTNNGSATTLSVESLALNNRRSFLKFDLAQCSPAIPSTASVKVATLRAYITLLPALCRTEDVFRVTASWTESGIKWNNQPAVAASRTDFVQVGTTSCANTSANVYLSWTVTSDVATFVAGTNTNYGWMIRDDAESNAVAELATFTAKDSGTATQAPQLVVDYV